MVYQALYRKWRPQSFDDVVGQGSVTQTLKNALTHHKMSHAYLFTGPRGTGKTSAAKIVAKAINCPHQKDGEPCNQCELCQAIAAGTLGDVIEIDAASNNGVEEIRDIRDKARYAPTQAEYKVYIIDEVHMLSTGAFNALLKTLEEPPQNVLFILATTEPHKIPATIISRTQRFDFKRITNKDIQQRLAYILEQEKLSFEEDALTVIARVSNGGMRDALSLLDQVISFGDGTINYQQAVQVSGSLTSEMMQKYMRHLMDHETSQALEQLLSLLQEGKEATRFVEELIEFSRDILVQQQTQQPNVYQPDEQAFIDSVDARFVYRFIHELNIAQQEMRFTTNPTICLEVLTIKMSQTASSTGSLSNDQSGDTIEMIEQLQQQVVQLQNTLQRITSQTAEGAPQQLESTSQRKAAPASTTTPQTQYKVNIALIYQILNQATKQDLTLIREVWQELLDCLSVTQRAILKAAEPVAASSQGFVLKFDYEILCQRAEQTPDLKVAVQEHCQRLIQYSGEFVCVPKEQWPVIRQEYILEKRKHQSEESASIATELPEENIVNTTEVSHPFEENQIEVEPLSEVEQLVQETMTLFGEEVTHIKE